MIHLTLSEVLVIGYLLFWPWLAAIVLLLLIGLWSFRSMRPGLYWTVLVGITVGSIPAAIYWVSELT